MGWSDEYRSADAFWAALKTRARVAAKASGGRPDKLTGEFVRQMFLARVFSAEQSPWAVAGGTGVLIRLPGARGTDDLDLVRHSPPSTAELAEGIVEFTGRSERDPFVFTVVNQHSFSGEIEGVKVRLSALIDGRRAHEFDVDLTAKTMIGRVVFKTPTLAVSGLRGISCPPVTVYPVASQAADKLAAMYRHLRSDHPEVSTRYRDLVDLALLSLHTSVAAEDLHEAVSRIRTSDVSAIPLPEAMVSPGGDWPSKYPAIARTAPGLPSELYDLDAALACVGRWLNPVLGGHVISGHGWDPQAGRWVPGGEIIEPDDDRGVHVVEHTRSDGATAVPEHRRSRPRRSSD